MLLSMGRSFVTGTGGGGGGPATDPLVTEYLTADEWNHDWANLTGWTTTGVQVSSNRLYGISGGNPTATGKAYAVAAGETVKVTAELVIVGTGSANLYLGVNFGGTNDGVNASLPNFAGVGIVNRHANRYAGGNFTGITTGSQSIGVRKSLTPFVTKSKAAGTIDGDIGVSIYRQATADLWRIHLPAGLDGETRAPVCIYFPQATSGVADSPLEARAVNIDQALDAAGYIVLSASDGGDRWGNQDSLDNFKALLDWTRAHVYCGEVVLLGVSGGAVTAWNAILRGDISEAVAVAGICPVCDLDAMEADSTFTASVRAAYGAADHAEYLTNSAGYNPVASANLANFTGLGVKFYCAASGDFTVPNADHVDVFEPLEDDYAAASTVDLSGTAHLDTEQFQGSDLVTFFNTYV